MTLKCIRCIQDTVATRVAEARRTHELWPDMKQTPLVVNVTLADRVGDADTIVNGNALCYEHLVDTDALLDPRSYESVRFVT